MAQMDIDPTEITGSIDLTFVFSSMEVTVPADVFEIGDAMEGTDMEGESMDEMGS